MTAGHVVHVRVNDAATGEPTPVRISFQAEGRSFAPLGRLEEFATSPGADLGGQVLLGSQPFHHIDGACEVRLPPGEVTVEVSKGPEFSPERKLVLLAPGQISLRLTVQRWTDLRTEGWWPGDTHALGLSAHAALLEGAAEGLAVVNLLAAEVPSPCSPPLWSQPNVLAFSGTSPALERPGCLVAVNTRNTHPVLGTLGLLNCHRAVYPLRFGGPDGQEDWSLADWCDQCHRKKTGLVVWSDPRALGSVSEGGRLGGEALADLILGKVDAFEVVFFDSTEPAALGEWYRLLDAGLRVPLVGGSGKDSNAIALGRVRTYAWLPPGTVLDYGEWIEAVRAGRTFVTNGPLLRLAVEGQGPGAVLAAASGQRLTVRAELSSAVRCDRLELLVNGAVVASKEPSGDALAAVVETQWAADRPAWVAARCFGAEALADGQCVFAQTSPAYVEVDGRPLQPDPAVVESLSEHLDRTAAWVATAARCPTDHHREQLLSLFSSARDRLRRGKASDG